MTNRTKEERQHEILPIIKKLNELHLTVTKYIELHALFVSMQKYIQEGIRINLNIPVEELNVTIKGVLAINVNERVWVKLEKK
jgi:hypothetical protein